MGALYWQLNDIWQAPTWSSIEFGGKWKALHYFTRKFLNNILVSPFEDHENQLLKVSLVRDDYMGDLEFNLTIKVYKWSQSKPVYEINVKEKTGSFSAPVVYTKSIPDLLREAKCVNRSECVLSFEVKNEQKNLKAHNFMLLTEPKNADIVKPNIKVVDIKKTGPKMFDIELSAETVAPFVWMDFKLGSGIRGNFSDNGFFIFDSHQSIKFESKSDSVTAQQIDENLVIMSVTDVK